MWSGIKTEVAAIAEQESEYRGSDEHDGANQR